MATVQNDEDLRRLLERLNPEQQRHIGATFIESALDLCDDARIRRAVEVAKDPEIADDIRRDAFQSARDYAVGTYTECGRDTDWSRQAAHFIGVATCMLCDEPREGEGNRAWKIAMQVRNARNCASIAYEGGGDIDDEAERQRRIADAFSSA